jgi:hypothetical protein
MHQVAPFTGAKHHRHWHWLLPIRRDEGPVGEANAARSFVEPSRTSSVASHRRRSTWAPSPRAPPELQTEPPAGAISSIRAVVVPIRRWWAALRTPLYPLYLPRTSPESIDAQVTGNLVVPSCCPPVNRPSPSKIQPPPVRLPRWWAHHRDPLDLLSILHLTQAPSCPEPCGFDAPGASLCAWGVSVRLKLQVEEDWVALRIDP